MHEAGLMQAALESACEEARRAGAIRIRRIVLSVGSNAGVVDEALQFAFEALSPGTFADGAALVIEQGAVSEALELARVEVEVP